MHAALRPAQDGPHARGQFPRGKRLGDVVVRAELQPDEPVGLVDARGEHDDGDVGLAPQGPAHVQPIAAGQIEVEDDQVGSFAPRNGQGVAAVARGGHAEPAAFEVVARQLDYFRFVVYDQDQLVHGFIMYHRSGE